MYEFFQGNIADCDPSGVVVVVQGIGYYLLTANPYRFKVGAEVTIYDQQIVRDNAIDLYGFADKAEKHLFQQLMRVSGIGPKSALAIIAGGDHAGLRDAIQAANITYLTRFPGIGKKTAQQIVLDLKDKVMLAEDTNLLMTSSSELTAEDQALQDGCDALLALGYREREVAKILPKLKQASADSAEAYIRLGLQLLH